MFRKRSTKNSLPSLQNITSIPQSIVELDEQNEELLSGGLIPIRDINISPTKQLIIVDGAPIS